MLVDDLPILPHTRIETFFPSGPLGSVEGMQRHRATYLRSSLYDFGVLLHRREATVDVALVQAAHSRAGGYSLGVSLDYTVEAASQAEITVLELGGGVPDTGPHLEERSDRFVPVEIGSTPATAVRTAKECDAVIARHIAEWIPDRATLQFGMASWTDAIADELRDRSHLRVHTGLVGDWARKLDAFGALERGHPIVGTGAGGSAEFYLWLERSRRVKLQSCINSHSPHVLEQLPRFVCVNSVLEVDLMGACNAEVGRNNRRGGLAGLLDFGRAANRNPGALSVVAMRATVGPHSRIVRRIIDEDSALPDLADVVVTEYGSADLRGADAPTRAERLIRVAAPEHREALASAARNTQSRTRNTQHLRREQRT